MLRLSSPPSPSGPSPPDLSPPRYQLIERGYQALEDASCARVNASIPPIPGADADAFMAAYRSFAGNGSEAHVLTLAQRVLSQAKVRAFLALPDSFVPGGLDAAMVTCAVLRQATPSGLARYAVRGAKEETLLGRLLLSPRLMRDMLVAGGAAGGRYGQAMEIYTKIIQESDSLSADGEASGAEPFWDDRSPSNILGRLALGTAVEHALPIQQRWGGATVDPVSRFLHYERAYLAGNLDPALEVLTAFECRYTTDSDATDDDLAWFRATAANFRPDHIATAYSWRYARTVRTDVAYGKPHCHAHGNICTGHYAEIPAAGGECGPRAFFGRFARKAFGLPTWGVTQPGHAAMSCWSPNGWHVLLGADWEYSYWSKRREQRSGPDFHLDVQSRELRGAHQGVLRGGWAALARKEAPVGAGWSPRARSGYGEGGLWGALMLYKKKLAVEVTPAQARQMNATLVPTKVEALLARWERKGAAPNISRDANGTVRLPAVAYTSRNASAAIVVMPSFDAGEQLLHQRGSLASPLSSSFSYELMVAEQDAGRHYLTANISTWHINQDLLVSVNASSGQSLPVAYTVGYWNETQPVEVWLGRGENVLTFFRSSDREIAIKEVRLYKTRPAVPPPPANYTPAPEPPRQAYIEVPASTTCARTGIADIIDADECGRACGILGKKFTGPRSRANITGCFVLADGEWEGRCNFNTNRSAFCAEPPCTVLGGTGREVCIRL